ncbi:hypothetical protein BDV41DRAFT_577954 [Aspergillus transmontanensis]|uniref:RNase III domain-containing protein n=1 Tax=Aspergillus transmontanensis TaxID=1034304 RepID=A0A5N6VUD0_9EURO|nr:hypothetical protein BDV41DRAFT_577954 [Aspergillus transmontanensis]
MASAEQAKTAESIIHYRFLIDNYIRRALTVAGADESCLGGNRALAVIGASWMDTVLMIVLMRTNVRRETKAKLKDGFTNKDHFTYAAKRTGISQYITYNCRSGMESPTVLRNTINATIAAVFLDSGSVRVSLGVIGCIFKPNDRSMLKYCSGHTVEAVSMITEATSAEEYTMPDESMYLPMTSGSQGQQPPTYCDTLLLDTGGPLIFSQEIMRPTSQLPSGLLTVGYDQVSFTCDSCQNLSLDLTGEMTAVDIGILVS